MKEYISQEALSFFGIKNVSFINSAGLTVLIRPIYIENEKWICTCSSTLSNMGILRINCINSNNNSEMEIDITVLAMKSNDILCFSNCYTLILRDSIPKHIEIKISQYKRLMNRTEKRKEVRYPIGQENWKLFKLKNPSCILNNLTGIQIPCVIINASAHGALVIGSRSLAFHLNEKILFAAEFKDKRVAQYATIVNTESIQDKYWRYSLHFSEPISLTWLSNLNKLAIKLENKN